MNYKLIITNDGVASGDGFEMIPEGNTTICNL